MNATHKLCQRRGLHLFILGWVTSLLTMTPDKTHESSSSPPGIYSEKLYKICLSSTAEIIKGLGQVSCGSQQLYSVLDFFRWLYIRHKSLGKPLQFFTSIFTIQFLTFSHNLINHEQNVMYWLQYDFLEDIYTKIKPWVYPE